MKQSADWRIRGDLDCDRLAQTFLTTSFTTWLPTDTYMFPRSSSAILLVNLKHASGPSHCARYLPLDESSCMRQLPDSTTKILPLLSTVRPVGSLNCPGPRPCPPYCASGTPKGENFWIRSFPGTKGLGSET